FSGPPNSRITTARIVLWPIASPLLRSTSARPLERRACPQIIRWRSRSGSSRSSARRSDRKSTRLNSSHEWISYAVFSLKTKTTVSVQIRLAQSLVQETEVGRAGLEDTAVQQHG